MTSSNRKSSEPSVLPVVRGNAESVNFNQHINHVQCHFEICRTTNHVSEISRNEGRCKRCRHFIDPVKDSEERIAVLQNEIAELMKMPKNQRDNEYLGIFKKQLGEERLRRRRMLAGMSPPDR